MKTNKFLFNLILFSLLNGSFYSCSQASNKHLKSEKEYSKVDNHRIVIIGSSTAEGAKASCRDSSWVGRLDKYLKSIHHKNEVINLAKSGYTTYHLISKSIKREKRPDSDTIRNIDFAISLNPTCIIINLPSNDAAYNYTNEEQILNFKHMVQKIKENSIKVYVCSAQPRNFKQYEKRQKQLELNQLLKKEFPYLFIDFWDGFAYSNGFINEKLNSGDGIHLNDLGHRMLYERVRKALDFLN